MLNLILQLEDIIKVGEMVLLTIVARGKIGSIRLRVLDMCTPKDLFLRDRNLIISFQIQDL